MGTPFKTIYERSLSLFRDYRLDNLFVKDEDAFYEFLRGFLLNSIDMFDGCFTDLSYSREEEVDDEDNIKIIYTFNQNLSSKEIYILSLGIAISWMTNNVNDVTQMNLHLSSKEFKNFSEANNLQRKQEVLDKMIENLSKNIIEYQLANLNKIPFFSINS